LSPLKCKQVTPDWESKCESCGASPILPLTGICGPCTFGEADTVGGDWMDQVTKRCDECDGSCKEVDSEQ